LSADSPSDSIGLLINDVARAMRREFNAHLQPTGLTLAQARALLYVSRHQGVRQVDLAELLDIQPMTLARVLDQLAAAGLVERRHDPADRRAFRLHLSHAAQPVVARVSRVAAATRERAARGLSRSEHDLLIGLLLRLKRNLPEADARGKHGMPRRSNGSRAAP
jgi:DNA-binding MarR family transcriptional regulator